MLFARCFAILLLFVAPAHATMQQIACEHLPTAYEQAYDGAKAAKLILRGQVEKTAYPLADLDRDDDAMIVSESVTVTRATGPVETIATPAPHFSHTLGTLALKRAPPFDTAHF